MICVSNARALCIGSLTSLLLCCITANVQAQVAGGSISGTITDNSSRVIGNVRIKITNIDTGVSREVTTNDEGVYSAPNLQSGTYRAEYSVQGFKTEARSGIEMTVGAAVVSDVTLTVGALHETVTVQSEVPAVQISTSDIS